MRGRAACVVLGSVAALGCSEPPGDAREPELVLTLLHTSDLHSRAWPFRSPISSFEAQLGLGAVGALEEVGGLARLATLLAGERARAPAALWLDSGDALEGAEVFQRFAGKPEIEVLSSLGLSAMALGNHELSLPLSELAARLDEASFPVLAANLAPRAGSPLAGRLAASRLLRAGGVWIGVIGVANAQTPAGLSRADNSWQLELATDTARAVQIAIDELASRAEVIVALSHLGLDADRELVRSTTGLDLVLGGHQHLVTEEPEWLDDCAAADLVRERGCSPRGVPIVHSGAYGKWLSRLELSLRVAGRRYEIERLSLRRAPARAEVQPAAGVRERLAQLELPPEPPLAFAPRRIARRAALGGDAPLGNLTTDAVQRATGADVVLLNTSGLRADLEAGLVRRADLELVFPFDEPWRQGLVPGSVLKGCLSRSARKSAARECTSTLQVAGMELSMHCGGSARAERLEARRGREQPLTDAERLLVVLPNYLTTPGSDFEELRGYTAPFEVDVVAALTADFSVRSRGAGAACRDAVREMSESGCWAAWGALSCPVAEAAAGALCAQLPRVEGTRDDRIQMLP